MLAENAYRPRNYETEPERPLIIDIGACEKLCLASVERLVCKYLCYSHIYVGITARIMTYSTVSRSSC